MNKNKKIKVKTKDQEIKELLTDLEKDLGNFKLDNDKKDRKLKEYIRLLELARNEYRKVVQENNLLKSQILGLRQSRPKQKNQIKRKYIVENTDSETDSRYKSDCQEKEEKEEDQYPVIKRKVKRKTVKKPNKTKNKSYLNI